MRRWQVFAATWLLLSFLAALWAFATPPGASPDEPAHAVKAASVVRGEFIGSYSPQGHEVTVPAYVSFLHQQTCYAFNGEVAADCMPELYGDPGELVMSTTSAGLYNPVYYLLVGWPSLVFHDESGIYAMRIVSGILTALFFALAATVVSTSRRPAIPLLGILAAATPMTLFLGGSINPNGLETSTILCVFVAMFAVTREPSDRLLTERMIILVIAAAVAANTRGLSLVWLALAILIPLVVLPGRRLLELTRHRPVQIAIGATALAAGLAAVWLSSTNSLDGNYVGEPMPHTGGPAWLGFAITFQNTFENGQNMVGVFGWLDTPAPPMVYLIWGGLLVAAGAVGVVVLRGRALIAAGLLVAAVVLVPPLLQAVFIGGGGYIWQGRYALPALACLYAGLLALVADALPEIPARDLQRLAVATIAALAVGHLAAFATSLRRYVTGLDGDWLQFLRDPEWQPPGGSIALLVLAALLGAASVILVARATREIRIPSVA